MEASYACASWQIASATTYFTAEDFQNNLFDNNPTGTMSDYYNEISHGNFSVDGSTHGWYESTYSMGEAKSNTKQYVAQIAQLADPDVDYAQYDNDGPDNVPNSGDDDGYVDGIAVVYSGCGEWGSGNNNLWPHMSNLGSYEYTTGDVGANGNNIIVKSYFVSPELAGGGDCYTDIIRPMGVYALDEFGHILVFLTSMTVMILMVLQRVLVTGVSWLVALGMGGLEIHLLTCQRGVSKKWVGLSL